MKKLQLPCESAVNGLEALEKYQAAPMQYFLILMDMGTTPLDCSPHRLFTDSCRSMQSLWKRSSGLTGFVADATSSWTETSFLSHKIHVIS